MAMNEDSASDGHEQLAFVRDELRFELGLLHQRVEVLIGAEAFLTIAYTAAMSTTASWGSVVSPVLAVLGLVLALLAWPGVRATVEITLGWTALQVQLLERPRGPSSGLWELRPAGRDVRRVGSQQWRSMLFFRAAPGLFALVWTVLTVVAVVSARPDA